MAARDPQWPLQADRALRRQPGVLSTSAPTPSRQSNLLRGRLASSQRSTLNRLDRQMDALLADEVTPSITHSRIRLIGTPDRRIVGRHGSVAGSEPVQDEPNVARRASQLLPVAVGLSLMPLASATSVADATPGRPRPPDLLRGNLRGQRPHLRLLPPGRQQLHHRPRLHRSSTENDPLLAADFLDDPLLLRKLGLVTVHADGFDRPGVQRGVPTLLGIARSLAPDFGAVGNRVHALGWSGDGVPEGRSLRDFATGAVREHLARTAGPRPRRGFPPADRAGAARAGEIHALARPERRRRAGAWRLHRRDLPLAPGR